MALSANSYSTLLAASTVADTFSPTESVESTALSVAVVCSLIMTAVSPQQRAEGEASLLTSAAASQPPLNLVDAINTDCARHRSCHLPPLVIVTLPQA